MIQENEIEDPANTHMNEVIDKGCMSPIEIGRIRSRHRKTGKKDRSKNNPSSKEGVKIDIPQHCLYDQSHLLEY